MALKTKEKTEDTAVTIPLEQEAVSGNSLAVLDDDDYGNHSGIGTDDISPSETTVPFYRILQSNSPQCDATQNSPLYDENARPGMLYNTVTGERLDGKVGITIVAVNRDHKFLEYIPRDAGGGFQGVWEPSDRRISALVKSQGAYNKLKLDNGNELIETYTLVALTTHPDGSINFGVLSFSSTQIKKFKSFMTRLLGLGSSLPRKPPIFAWRWQFGTQPEKNKKGSYYGWRIALYGGAEETARLKPSDPLYRKALDFYEMLQLGDAKVDYATDTGAANEPSEGDEEIPF